GATPPSRRATHPGWCSVPPGCPPEAPVPAGTHPRAASTRSGAGAPPQFAAPTDRRSFLPFSTQPPARTLMVHNSRKKSTLLVCREESRGSIDELEPFPARRDEDASNLFDG